MSVRARATLITAIFLTLASSVLSILLYRAQRANLTAEASRKVEVALTMLSEMAAAPLSTGDTYVLALIADRAARGQPERVSIADRKGLILVDSAHRDYNRTNSAITSALESNKQVIVRSRRLWHAAAPIFDQSNSLVGYVYVTFTTRYIQRALYNLAATVISFAVLATLLGAAVAYFFGRYLSTAFKPLTEGIRRTASGDFSRAVEPVGVTELDDIASAFNRMSQIVGNRVYRLETLNETAAKLPSARSFSEVSQSLRQVCGILFNSDCNLLIGDPRSGILRLIDGAPLIRAVTPACLATVVIRKRSPMSIGVGGDREPGTQVAEGYKPQSAIVAPLITPENDVVGVLSVDFGTDPLPFPTREAAAAVESLSILIAPMLAVVQRSQAQEQSVAALREILLPESPTVPENVDAYAVYEEAEKTTGFSGDYYDVLQLSGGLWAAAIGDVSGKGLAAGRYTAMAKYVVRSFALEHPEPAEAIQHANSALAAQMGDESMFLTLFLGILDTEHHKFTYCCAGHLPALLYSRRDGTVRQLGVGGMVVGVKEDAVYKEETIDIQPGDLLMLYTDGIIEARRGAELYEIERLQEIFQKNAEKDLPEVASAIIEDVRNFATMGFQDDFAIVLIRVTI